GRADLAGGRSDSERPAGPRGWESQCESLLPKGAGRLPGAPFQSPGRDVGREEHRALLHEPKGHAHGRVHGAFASGQGVAGGGELQWLTEAGVKSHCFLSLIASMTLLAGCPVTSIPPSLPSSRTLSEPVPEQAAGPYVHAPSKVTFPEGSGGVHVRSDGALPPEAVGPAPPRGPPR